MYTQPSEKMEAVMTDGFKISKDRAFAIGLIIGLILGVLFGKLLTGFVGGLVFGLLLRYFFGQEYEE